MSIHSGEKKLLRLKAKLSRVVKTDFGVMPESLFIEKLVKMGARPNSEKGTKTFIRAELPNGDYWEIRRDTPAAKYLSELAWQADSKKEAKAYEVWSKDGSRLLSACSSLEEAAEDHCGRDVLITRAHKHPLRVEEEDEYEWHCNRAREENR